MLRLLEGQALHPAFVDQVLHLTCGNRADDGRAQLEAERDALTETINRLVALAEAGAGDVAELASKLKTRTAERDAFNRRLAALAEPPDRATLKAALEQRCADWRERLRSDHREEARYIVQQLIGPLELWVGSRKQEREKERALAALGVTADDVRGKEDIEWSDCGFAGTLSPLGLLNGLCVLNMVAGAGFEPATFGL